MKTWLAIALFVFAVVAFFFIARVETRRSHSEQARVTQALQKADQSLDRELEREQAKPSTPGMNDRAVFLNKQKQILAEAGKAHMEPRGPFPPPPEPSPVTGANQSSNVANYMQVIVTGVVGLVSVWIILSGTKKQDDDARKWAFGALGTIIGFWLKG